jgi:hypothetical protein
MDEHKKVRKERERKKKGKKNEVKKTKKLLSFYIVCIPIYSEQEEDHAI